MDNIINFKTDYFFSTISRVLGSVIMFIGFLGIFTRGPEMLLICIVGIGLSFTRYGVLIDKDKRLIKEYTEIFWIKFGKWESMHYYPYLTVLEITEKNSMYSRANVEHSSRTMVFRITLLNDNHYTKILLKQLKDKEVAHTIAKEIAEDLNLKKVVYSPG